MQRKTWGQWRARARQVALATILLISAAVVFFKGLLLESDASILRVYVKEKFSTFDPIKFDLSHLQPLQSVANIKLFSNFSDAQIRPQLARSWKSLDSGARWIIQIRGDVFFKNGKQVTNEDVALSLKRIALISKNKKSRNGFVENLKGIERLGSVNQEYFEGIQARGDSIELSFTKPMPNLLDLLSFGVYAIVSKENYSVDDGAWIDLPMEKYNGAGPYAVERHSDDLTSVALREDYPRDLFHEKAFKKISFGNLREFLVDADIAAGSQDLAKIMGNKTFHGVGKTEIIYLFSHSWKLIGGPLSDSRVRISLRERLLSKLAISDPTRPRSFFPLIMNGVESVSTPARLLGDSTGGGREISYIDRRPHSSSMVTEIVNALEESLTEKGFKAISKKGVPFEVMVLNKYPDRKKFDVDIGVYSTEVSAIEPLQDIRLMFSHEGINLPDTDGRIKSELRKDSFPAQAINRLIFEQGVVWPVGHRVLGVWANDKIDFSRYNKILLLGDLQWLGNKE